MGVGEEREGGRKEGSVSLKVKGGKRDRYGREKKRVMEEKGEERRWAERVK